MIIKKTMCTQDNDFFEYAATLRQKYIHNREIVLVQAPQFIPNSFRWDVARQQGYYAYPPTGLQCLMTVLKDQNF